VGSVFFQQDVCAYTERIGKVVSFPETPNFVVWTTKAIGVILGKNVSASFTNWRYRSRILLHILPKLLDGV